MLSTVLRVAAPPRHGRALGIALAILASLLAGCITDTSPLASRDNAGGLAARVTGAVPDPALVQSHGLAFDHSAGFTVPLEPNDAWDYDIHTRYVTVTCAGSQDPVLTSAELHIQLSETFGAASGYVTQSETWMEAGSSPIMSTFLCRQDRTGLYVLDSPPRLAATTAEPGVPEAALASVRPAQHEAFRRAGAELAQRMRIARDAAQWGWHRGGALPGEITVLRYPLRIGARWAVRPDGSFSRVVVGHDALQLPAGAFRAWRLSGLSTLYGPNDVVHFWYSPAGFMQMVMHIEANATDDQGNVIGKVMADQREELRAFSLVAPHALAERLP
jgi:hypothetical protein